jgi:GST-like protein
MIDLYTAATPSGWKASVTLEELALPYLATRIDLRANEHKQAWFLKINPNGRIPAIVDRDAENFAVFESGAIMIYLAELAGRLLPEAPKARSRALQWLMFQASGVGPMMGQAYVFMRKWPQQEPAIIDRYRRECRQAFEVLDSRLEQAEYLAAEFSIADIANWAWVRMHPVLEMPLEGLVHLQRWLNAVETRPASQRGLRVADG